MTLNPCLEPRRLAPSVFSLARGTQLARRRHRLIERRRRAQKGVWSAYPQYRKSHPVSVFWAVRHC